MATNNSESNEQNFNENELEDIMNEIESLEREVVQESASTSSPSSEGSGEESGQEEETHDLQAAIDEEMNQAVESSQDEGPEQENASSESNEHENEEDAIEFDEGELEALECDDDEGGESSSEDEDNVVAFSNKTQTPSPKFTPTSKSDSPVELKAHGPMGLDLKFALGEKVANLEIDSNEGLSVELDGFSLHLHPDKGCQVRLEGGVEFNVPIHPTQDNVNKKAS